MEKKCPHCEEIIDYVIYSTRVTEFGTAQISRNSFEDHEYSDNDYDSDYAYRCPKCDYELEYEDLWDIDVEEDDDGQWTNKPQSVEWRVQ
jgi:phage FluMu protein Com